jgi:uncharacterized membrane protein
MQEYKKYIILAIIILLLDGLWIYSNFKMYSDAVKAVQKSEMVIRPYAVVIAYIMVMFASLYVAVQFTRQNVKKGDTIEQKLYKSFIYGGAAGLAVYGVYNFTSLSIYKNFTLSLAVIDTTFGTFLNTLAVFIYLLLD